MLFFRKNIFIIYILFILFIISRSSCAQGGITLFGTIESNLNGNTYFFSFNVQTSQMNVLHKFTTMLEDCRDGSINQIGDSTICGLSILGGERDHGYIYEYNFISDKFRIMMNINDIYGIGYKVIDTNNLNGQEFFADATMVKGIDGNLYGYASFGKSTPSGDGVIFQCNLHTLEPKILYTLRNMSVDDKVVGLIQAQDNKLYGVGPGGLSGSGVLFEYDLTKDKYLVIKNFNDHSGRLPYGNLVQTLDGKLYGVTKLGGIESKKNKKVRNITDWGISYGVIYSYDPVNNKESTVLKFNPSITGRSPTGDLILASNGCIYGLAKGEQNRKSILFKYDPSTQKYEIIFKPDGLIRSLMQATDGNIYLSMINEECESAIYQFNPVTKINTLVYKINKGEVLVGKLIQIK